MLAGALLLAVVWVFLLRYVPDEVIYGLPGSPPRPLRPPGRLRSGGHRAGVPAGVRPPGRMDLAGRMLAPLARITDATRTAATGSLSHRIRLPGRNDEFRELADAFDSMLARLEAQVAEQQRFAANASHELRTPLAITQTLLDVARNDPSRDNGELVDRLHAVNTRAIDLTEALLLLSRADQRSFAPSTSTCRSSPEEATETLLPLAEERGVTIETSGDVAPTIGSRALPAADDDEPRAQRDRPQPARAGRRVGHDRRSPRERGAHRREHRREAHPTAGRHARRAVPARHRAHTHRPRGRRPRPGDRQEHRPGARRDPHLTPGPPAGSASRCSSPPPHPGDAPRRCPPASSGRPACGRRRSRRTAPIPARWRSVPSGRTAP